MRALMPAQAKTQASKSDSSTSVSGLIQRKCACGSAAGLTGSCPACESERRFGTQPIQTKLKISEPGDQYEQEADRVAGQVMRMADPAVQRQPMPEGEEEAETLQMKPIVANITPLVQRAMTDDKKTKGAAPATRGKKLSLFPRQQDAASEGADPRKFTGPTAVPAVEEPGGPSALSPRNWQPDTGTLDQWRIEQLMETRPPKDVQPGQIAGEAVRESLDKIAEGIALKWSVDPDLVKRLVRSGLKGLGKLTIHRAIEAITPDPKTQEGLKKDLDALWKQRQGLERKTDIPEKKDEALQRQSLADEKR